MKTRNGKIARLPKTIREELNHRLEDGCLGPQLVEWLNSLPEVQELLQTEFNGQPINETNLTYWRQGGYLDWLRHQEMQDQIQLLIERSSDIEQEEIDSGHLSDQIARVTNFELAWQIQQLNTIEDPDKRWKKFQEFSRELCRLQNGAQYARHVQLGWSRWEAELHREDAARAKDRAEAEVLMDYLRDIARNGLRPRREDETGAKLSQIKVN